MPDDKTKEQELPEQDSAVEEARKFSELKAENDKLKAQNADLQAAKEKYYDAILNHQEPPEDNGPKVRSREEIRKELFDGKQRSNLEYAKLTVELDDACRREQGQSCFAPMNHEEGPTADELQKADKCRKILDESIKKADGDPEVFNSTWKTIRV